MNDPRDTHEPLNAPFISDEEPDSDVNLGEILNAPVFQALMDDFYVLSGIPIGVLDLKGNILVAKGWQNICTRFHRMHPETCAFCHESDIQLTEGIALGEFRQYKCRNNLWDIATPIYVGNVRMGNIFLGQFFFDDEVRDVEFFREQARRYGFDEAEYLAALDDVPVFSHEKVRCAMSFYAKLAGILSSISYKNFLLNKSLQEIQNRIAFQQTLMDAVPSPIFYKDSNRIYMDGNKAFEEFIGIPRDSFAGKSVFDLSPPDLAEIYDRSDRELQETGGPQIYEAAVQTADGSRRDVIFRKAVFDDALGRPAGIIGVIQDVTEQKQAEESIRQANELLEMKVEDRTSELTAMNEELIAMNEELVSTLDRLKQTQQQLLQSEKLAALGGLVSGIAHEISTPLGISVTSVSYVQRELHQMSRNFREGTLTRSDFDEFLTSATPVIDTAETNLERAALLLGSFKQLSADQTHDTLRRFNAKDYLEELLLSLQGLLKTRDCSMTLDCPDDLEIVGSPGLLSQVVTNLVSNAVKHGFDPHVPGSIRMELKKEGVVTTLIFSDDGKGMSEAVQEHIFEPFFSTRQGIHSELGLGLHMVHTIVTQRFGGEIRCITSPGQGTRFILTIPDSI